MLTFRRFTMLFFLCLLGLNVISIFFCGPELNFICRHMAAWYLWMIGLYAGISVLLAFFPHSQFHHATLWRGKCSERTVALTFDDGPDPVNTPKVLEILRRNKITATFFFTGKQAEQHQEIVRQVFSEGHVIGNHSWSHSPWFDFFPPRKIGKELLATNELIRSETGKYPVLFRPPFGVINPLVSKAIRKTGMKAVAWSIRPYDTARINPETILRRILRKLEPGGIILLHDHSPFTSEYLEILIIRIRERKYDLVPIDKLLELNAYD